MITQLIDPDNAKREVHIEAQGRLFALARKSDATTRPGGGRRGLVSGFSDASRRRLLRKFARLQHVPTKFYTLTYPDEFPDPAKAKDHLRAFMERMRRAYPKASGIWRLEFQDRGAPHFHILFFNLPFIHWSHISKAWKEIIGVPQDEYVRIEVKAVRSFRGVMSYASKYVCKPTDDETDAVGGETDAVGGEEGSDSDPTFISNAYLHAGRVWGVHNRDFLPYAPKVYIVFREQTGRAFHDAKRYMRRIYPYITRARAKGGCLFTDKAYLVHNTVMRLLLSDASDFLYRGELVELQR